MLTEFSHLIKFPWGQDRKVLKTLRRRAVYPSNGDLHMRCGVCGSTDFTAHVKPTAFGAAKLTNLVCSLCGKIFPFDDKGQTGGTLHIENANARKREAINARSDN